MRTSNKVILFALLVFFVVVLVVILMLRSHAVGVKYSAVSAYAKIFGNGNVVTQKYSFTNDKFSAIDVKIPCHVEVKIAGKAPQGRGVAISTDSNLLPYISAHVVNGTLQISSNKDIPLESTFATKVVVTTDNLRTLSSHGSSKIVVSNISANNFNLNIQGLGESVLQGRVDNFVVNVYGSGKVIANDLLANNVKVNVNGSADVTVYATKKLNVIIKGSSSVKYYGNPGQVVRFIHGFGEIRKVGDGLATNLKNELYSTKTGFHDVTPIDSNRKKRNSP